MGKNTYKVPVKDNDRQLKKLKAERSKARYALESFLKKDKKITVDRDTPSNDTLGNGLGEITLTSRKESQALNSPSLPASRAQKLAVKILDICEDEVAYGKSDQQIYVDDEGEISVGKASLEAEKSTVRELDPLLKKYKEKLFKIEEKGGKGIVKKASENRKAREENLIAVKASKGSGGLVL
jgi:hypothetical protein